MGWFWLACWWWVRSKRDVILMIQWKSCERNFLINDTLSFAGPTRNDIESRWWDNKRKLNGFSSLSFLPLLFGCGTQHNWATTWWIVEQKILKFPWRHPSSSSSIFHTNFISLSCASWMNITMSIEISRRDELKMSQWKGSSSATVVLIVFDITS